MEVVAYTRVSTASQVEKYGLDVQSSEIARFCETNGHTIVASFSDEGISGAMNEAEDLSARVGFVNMIFFLKENPNVQRVVVLNTSRLWRDEGAHIYITRELRKMNVEVFAVQEPTFSLYSTDPTQTLFNTILAAFDCYERQCINMRLANGRRYKAEKMRTKPAGSLPYGYVYAPDRKSVLINEEQAKVVQGIFSMRMAGRSIRDIAKYLNAHHYPAPASEAWNPSAVERTLKNDFYISVLSHRKVKYWATHKAIIDKSLWAKLYPDYDFSQIA